MCGAKSTKSPVSGLKRVPDRGHSTFSKPNCLRPRVRQLNLREIFHRALSSARILQTRFTTRRKKFRPDIASGDDPAELSHGEFPLTVQAALRRALVLRAAGRARFATLRRTLPERLETDRFAFARRAGFAFFFAILAIALLSFSFPVLPNKRIATTLRGWKMSHDCKLGLNGLVLG